MVVPDKQIACAIHDIEQRNNMPEGALRQRLASMGVSVRTLVDQIRVQLAWTQVLREQLADKINIPDSEIDEQMRLHDRLMSGGLYADEALVRRLLDPGFTIESLTRVRSEAHLHGLCVARKQPV